MSYSFAADSEQLSSLAEEIRGKAGAVDGYINGTFKLLNGFPESTWSGESYESFKSGCGAYQNALGTVSSVMSSFAQSFDDASGGVEPLKGQVGSALDTIS